MDNIELILGLCDHIISVADDSKIKLWGTVQILNNGSYDNINKDYLTTLQKDHSLDWYLEISKCTKVSLGTKLQISVKQEKNYPGITDTTINRKEDVTSIGISYEKKEGMFSFGIPIVWLESHVAKPFGSGTYKVVLVAKSKSTGNQYSSNAEELAINSPERANERVAEAVEKNTSAIQNINNNGVNVKLGRASVEPADEQKALFDLLRLRRPNFSTVRVQGGADIIGYHEFMNDLLSGLTINPDYNLPYTRNGDRRLDFPLVDSYEVLKFGTEAFLKSHSPIGLISDPRIPLPYYEAIRHKLEDTSNILLDRTNVLNQENINSLLRIPSIELIWSYWMEQGMLVQTMNAISLRYQNISDYHRNDPLARLDIDPLRPLNNLLWGYIQDEQHSLSIRRRAYEYDHSYGLTLQGRAVPVFRSVDSRSKFLEAFHSLLHSVSIYYKESDDTTRIPDAFPLLNALREIHLLLAEGNHNSYGNLTWTARIEMMIQQYILARPEMREFLGGRIMVPFQEPWMDRVDTMRQIQNWGSTSITYYTDLAEFGELIILSIRLTNWSDPNIQSNVAAVWANSFRDAIQRYIHSYRTVTGVDLSADAQLKEASFMQPSILIQHRMQSELRGPLRNSRIVGNNQSLLM